MEGNGFGSRASPLELVFGELEFNTEVGHVGFLHLPQPLDPSEQGAAPVLKLSAL